MNKLLKNKNGVILVTILMFTSVMMILVMGIVSTNVSEVTLGQRQIDRIKYEQLLLAASLNHADDVYRGLNPTSIILYLPLDGKNYNVSTVKAGTLITASSGTF